EARRQLLVVLHRHAGAEHHPLAESQRSLAVPLARRQRVEAPVDEEAVLRLSEPFETFLLRGVDRTRSRWGLRAGGNDEERKGREDRQGSFHTGLRNSVERTAARHAAGGWGSRCRSPPARRVSC